MHAMAIYAFWLGCAPRSDLLFLSVVTATHTHQLINWIWFPVSQLPYYT